MAFNQLAAEEIQIVPAFVPVDMSAGANNGVWVSMKNYDRATLILYKAIGTAGDDPVLTVEQAQDVSGTGAKALNFTRVDYKQGATSVLTVGTYSTATQAAANTYTDLTSAENQGLYLIEIKSDMLDVDNGFDCIRLRVPDIGANAQLGCAFYLLRNPRYAGPMPSALAN